MQLLSARLAAPNQRANGTVRFPERRTLSHQEIREIVNTGEFSDQRAADWIADCLIQRRDKIVAAWFSRVLPLDRFRIVDGRLAFDDLSAMRGGIPARAHDVQWSSFDNDHGRVTALPNASGTKVPPVSGAEYLAVTITCSGAGEGACPGPVTVYLRHTGAAFELVGVDR